MAMLPLTNPFKSANGGLSRPEQARTRAHRAASPPGEDIEAQTSFSDSTTVVEEPQGTPPVANLSQSASDLMGRLAYRLLPCCTGPQSRRMNNIDTCGGVSAIIIILCASALILLAMVLKIHTVVSNRQGH